MTRQINNISQIIFDNKLNFFIKYEPLEILFFIDLFFLINFIVAIQASKEIVSPPKFLNKKFYPYFSLFFLPTTADIGYPFSIAFPKVDMSGTILYNFCAPPSDTQIQYKFHQKLKLLFFYIFFDFL